MSIFGLVLFSIYGILLNGVRTTLLGGIAGFAILLAFYGFGILYAKMVRKSPNVDSGEVMFGFGDVYVGTFLGLFVGWPLVIPTVVIGMLLAGIFSVFHIVIQIITQRYQRYSGIPLSPFFIIAAVSSLYIY